MTTDTVRRVLALLMSLSMLHLVMVGGGSACVSHEASAQGMAPSAMPGMHTARAPMAPAASAPRDCASPMPVLCCAAVSGCAVALDLRSPARARTPAIVRASTPVHAAMLFASIDTAPEPPPPKG